MSTVGWLALGGVALLVLKPGILGGSGSSSSSSSGSGSTSNTSSSGGLAGQIIGGIVGVVETGFKTNWGASPTTTPTALNS